MFNWSFWFIISIIVVYIAIMFGIVRSMISKA